MLDARYTNGIDQTRQVQSRRRQGESQGQQAEMKVMEYVLVAETPQLEQYDVVVIMPGAYEVGALRGTEGSH